MSTGQVTSPADVNQCWGQLTFISGDENESKAHMTAQDFPALI